MSLFDGLLDPNHDLLLLHLSLKTPTRTSLTQQAILRPPAFTPPQNTPPQSILHLPPLPIPWASSLVAALHTHLSISVCTVPDTSPSSTPPTFTSIVLRDLENTTPSCPAFASLAHRLYPPVSSIYQVHNRNVLHRLRCKWGFGALHRVAIHTKLAFLIPLLRVLHQQVASVTQQYSTIPVSIDSQLRGNTPTPSRAATPTIIPRHTSRTRKKRVITVKGRWIKDNTKYILDGVVLDARLVAAVGSLLETKYGVRVCYERDREVKVLRRGMLVSLSNRGTALLGVGESDLRGGCGADVGECVGEYLWRRYGVNWQLVSIELVKMAEVLVEKEERRKMPTVVAKLKSAMELGNKTKEELVTSALLYEVGGARLSKICAFKIAEGEMWMEAEEALGQWGEEYGKGVRDARRTLERLRSGAVGSAVGKEPIRQSGSRA